MKNIPEKIYLQVGEDVEQDEDFKELDTEAVTWCTDKIFANDIEYIRKDLISQYMQCDEACEYHCTKNGEQEKECEQRITMVNIGTDKKNILNVTFNKPFSDITYNDIMEVLQDRLGNSEKYTVHGWCDVTDKTPE